MIIDVLMNLFHSLMNNNIGKIDLCKDCGRWYIKRCKNMRIKTITIYSDVEYQLVHHFYN